jgi:putative salt-induced outer membrane protein YdiY
MAQLKYNKFFTPLWSSFLNQKVSFDKFKDLELRTEESVGTRYRILNKSQLSLDLNIGIARIDSIYKKETNAGYFSIPIGYDLQWIIHEKTTFIQETQCLFSPEKMGEFLFTLCSRIELPLSSSWAFTINHDLEHNANPPGLKKKIDQSLKLRLGYRF